MACFEQRLRDVRPPDRAFTRDLQDALEAHRRAHPGQHLSHFPRSADAAFADARQFRVQLLVVGIHEVAEDVRLGAGHVGVDLHARDHLDVHLLSGGLGLCHTGRGVVVGDGDDFDRQPGCARNQLLRGVRPVGGDGVSVQVDFIHDDDHRP